MFDDIKSQINQLSDDEICLPILIIKMLFF